MSESKSPIHNPEQDYLYFDMDGVLCDFEARAVEILTQSGVTSDHPNWKNMVSDCQDVPGFYRSLPTVPGALDAFMELDELYNCYILSAPSWTNPLSWTEKCQWVMEHLGDRAYKKLILSHNKGMFRGRALIDDRTKYGVPDFKGEHIHFGTHRFPNWDVVVAYLKVPRPTPGHRYSLDLGSAPTEVRILPPTDNDIIRVKYLNSSDAREETFGLDEWNLLSPTRAK